MPDINRYAFWQKAVKGEDVPSDKDTMAGFYRHYWDRKDGGPVWHAVAIWYDRETSAPVMSAQYKRDLITDPDEIYEKFGWVSRYPIPHDIYVAVVQHNEPWPALYETRTPMKPAGALWTKEIGEQILAKANAKASKKALVDNVQPATVAAASDAPENERAVPGDNSGKPDDLPPERKFLAAINDSKDKFNSWLKGIGGKVTNEDQEKVAAGYAREFRDYRLSAEKACEAENRPIIDAGKAIKAKWKEVTTAAAKLANDAVSSADDFVAERRRKQREEEEAARKAEIDAKINAPVGAVIVSAPVVAPMASGGFKAKAVKVVIIDDIEKVKAAFMKTADGREAAEEWAKRAGLKFEIDGTHVEDKEEARI